MPHPHFEAILLGWGALCAFIGLLAGIAMSRGAMRAELRDFWRRGYAYAKREAATRHGNVAMKVARISPDADIYRDVMAQPYGDVPLVPEAHHHG